MQQFGAHIHLLDPVAEAQARGADIVQIMIGDPQSWKKPTANYPGGHEALRAATEAAGVGVYVHSAYVINVASTNNRIRIPSRKLLQQTIDAAAEIGAKGVIVHGGHVTADDDPLAGHVNWRKCIDGLDIKVPLLIENTAGGNKAMARTLEAIALTWEAISGSDNAGSVGFCLDTCHAHASGLDMTSVVDDVRAITGRIDLVHCNDSRDVAGSGRDRHAALGKGEIDPEVIAAVVRDAACDVILETPGDVAEHAGEIDWLRKVAATA